MWAEDERDMDISISDTSINPSLMYCQSDKQISIIIFYDFTVDLVHLYYIILFYFDVNFSSLSFLEEGCVV